MTLDRFTEKHRNAYISMQQCAEHISYQLPNQRTRVGYLLDAIQCPDPELQAALAGVRKDDSPDGLTGMRNDFESTVAYVLPSDPVARKKKSNTNKNATADIGSTTGIKAGIGKTGVEMRYHKRSEYGKLTTEQRHELREWRETAEGKKALDKYSSKRKARGDDQRSSKLRKTIASVLKEQQEILDKETKDDDDQVKVLKEVLVSFIDSKDTASDKTKKSAESGEDKAQVVALKLHSILKRGKPNK